jgi:hypothetical protein
VGPFKLWSGRESISEVEWKGQFWVSGINVSRLWGAILGAPRRLIYVLHHIGQSSMHMAPSKEYEARTHLLQKIIRFMLSQTQAWEGERFLSGE